MLAAVSMFAGLVGSSMAAACSFDVQGYIDGGCSIPLGAPVSYANQVEGQCSKGTRADYPYYKWACDGANGLSLSFFKEADCKTGAYAKNPESFTFGQCGYADLQGVFAKATTSSCCGAMPEMGGDSDNEAPPARGPVDKVKFPRLGNGKKAMKNAMAKLKRAKQTGLNGRSLSDVKQHVVKTIKATRGAKAPKLGHEGEKPATEQIPSGKLDDGRVTK